MSNEKSMKDYENELERSFQVLREGDTCITTPRALSQSRNAAMIRPSPSKKIW